MIPVIIVSFFVLIAFVTFLVFLIKMILSSIKKEPVKSLIIKTIVSGVAWAVLGCVNVVLIALMLINGDPLLDSILEAGTDAASKALVLTFEGLEKSWDKETLAKANKVGFSVKSVNKTEKKDKDRYDIKLLLESKLERGERIGYWDLTSQNLLFGLDNNGVFHPCEITDQPPESIPMGKSYLSISIDVPKFATLSQIGLGEQKQVVPK